MNFKTGRVVSVEHSKHSRGWTAKVSCGRNVFHINDGHECRIRMIGNELNIELYSRRKKPSVGARISFQIDPSKPSGCQVKRWWYTEEYRAEKQKLYPKGRRVR